MMSRPNSVAELYVVGGSCFAAAVVLLVLKPSNGFLDASFLLLVLNCELP